MTSRDLVGSDVSDSVYKEAVTKLKILLSATEHPTMRIGDLKQSGQDKSKSLDQLFTGEREAQEVKPSGQGTPRREPLFTRLPPRQSNSSVRRQLFGGGERARGLRGRHNSWHNLTQLEQQPGEAPHPARTGQSLLSA